MNDFVFKKIENIAKTVKADLRKKGLVVPVENTDGSVSMDTYTIVKKTTGFYAIMDRFADIVVDDINLPQTAAVLANNLALGKWLDSDLLRQDKIYGYKLFEEQLFNHHGSANLKKLDYDKAEVNFTKAKIARYKKMGAKEAVLKSFDKLRRMR